MKTKEKKWILMRFDKIQQLIFKFAALVYTVYTVYTLLVLKATKGKIKDCRFIGAVVVLVDASLN